jgi:hypothetical protein
MAFQGERDPGLDLVDRRRRLRRMQIEFHVTLPHRFGAARRRRNRLAGDFWRDNG